MQGEDAARRSLQERFESAVAGRVLISVFLVLTLFSIITANLYPSYLKRQFLRFAKPYVYVTGLDQGWDVFAPDPPRRTLALRARIVYADGTVDSWKIPRGNSLSGAYWDYRWRKWVENMFGALASEEISRPAARWIARNHADERRSPRQVELVLRWYDIEAPGVEPARTPWRQATLHRLDLGEKGGR